ncbi:MAG: DUF3822 family protein [Bernardetiaceae bacterium]|nr:DUF3822 family protein [Bernardetiaceae bacterium]
MHFYHSDQVLQDDAFDIDHIGRYLLVLAPSEKYCTIAVFDTNQARCVCLEYYETTRERNRNQENIAEKVKHLIQSHRFIGAGYWKKVLLIVDNPVFTYLPSEYFDEQHALPLLKLNVQVDLKQSYIQYSEIEKTKSHCIFSVEKNLSDIIELTYQNAPVAYTHQSTAFIKGLLNKNDTHKDILQVFFNENAIIIAQVAEQKLLFVNHYRFHQKEDIIYFILAIAKAKNIKRKTLQVCLHGKIKEDSSVVALLRRYVTRIDFGYRPEDINFGYRFAETEPHEFFDIYGAYFQ